LETTGRSSWKKRALLVAGGAVVFLLVFVFAIRITVSEMFRGIASEKATGLSAVADWDLRSMWTGGLYQLSKVPSDVGTGWIVRSAELQIRSSAFENSVASQHRIVAGHHGYLEDLRTESRTGVGRALAATISVPTEEFDGALHLHQLFGY
jgi:hypothetical protein